MKRLTDIAYGDSDVKESEREAALGLAEAIVKDIEAGLSTADAVRPRRGGVHDL